MQRGDVAVRPHIVDEGFHYRPKQWRRLPFTPRPWGSGRREIGRFGRCLQDAGTATQRRGRFDPRIVRCALPYAGPTLSARVDARRRRLQELLCGILICQTERRTGGIQARMRRKARRQHRQTRGKTITGRNHGTTRGVHRLRINGQGSHVRNFRAGPHVAATHPMIGAAKLATVTSPSQFVRPQPQATGTTISSCGRLLTARAPSSVTTTMSSMRAPQRPGK